MRQSIVESGTRLHKIQLRGTTLRVYDDATSTAPDIVRSEMEADCYAVERVAFAAGDWVIDIGGHVGIFSIYLARRYPQIRILAYEPARRNYRHFLQNIEANRVTNVQVFNLAVTGDGRLLDMLVHRANTGGASAQLRSMALPDHEPFTAASITLDRIFQAHNVAKCKLLKIDCEGSEHEALLNATCLDRIDYLSGEFHINEHLLRKGYSIEKLAAHCGKFIGAENIVYTACHMAE